MMERRLPPPGLRRPATGTRTTKPHALLMVARRYAETEPVRAFGAFVAVVVLVVLSGLAWFWLFGAPAGTAGTIPIVLSIGHDPVASGMISSVP
jgi:hypothetical protein